MNGHNSGNSWITVQMNTTTTTLCFVRHLPLHQVTPHLNGISTWVQYIWTSPPLPLPTHAYSYVHTSVLFHGGEVYVRLPCSFPVPSLPLLLLSPFHNHPYTDQQIVYYDIKVYNTYDLLHIKSRHIPRDPKHKHRLTFHGLCSLLLLPPYFVHLIPNIWLSKRHTCV